MANINSKKFFMKKINLIIAIAIGLFVFAGCKGGGDEVKVPKEGDLLMKYAWKLQPNESLNATTDSLEDATNITADVQLDGDVEDIANFLAETLTFSRDKKDKSKLAYSSTIGEGILSTSVVGYWEISDDGKELTLKQWDSSAGKTLEPVVYTIIEISDDKLVLENKATGGTKIYFPK